MAKSVLCLVVLFGLINLTGHCEAIGGNKPEPHHSVFWDFYSANDIGARVWAMGGAGVANVNDLTAMVINPAAFNFDSRFQFYFEVLSKSKNRWLKTIRDTDCYLKSPTLLPTFAGLGYRIGDRISTGVGYTLAKYYKLDLGEMSPPFDLQSEQTMHPYDVFESRQLVWPINFEVSGCVFLGANLNYNFLSLDQRGYLGNYYYDPHTLMPLSKDSEVHFLSFKLGLLVEASQLLNLHIAKAKIGVVYTPQESIRPTVKWKLRSEEYWQQEFGETILPRRLELGMKISDLPFPLIFAGDVKFHDNSEVEDLVDRWDIHLGCEWEATEYVAFQLGYFNRLDYRDPDTGWLDEVGEYDQHFLTLGVSFELKRFLLQASLRNSDLLSKGLMEQTHFSVGTGFHF